MKITPMSLPLARQARLFLTTAAFLVAAGCATAPPRPSVVFPPPPDIARIEYIRSFGSERDLRTSFFSRVLEVLVPRARNAAIVSPYGIALSPDDKTLYVAASVSGRVIAIDVDAGHFRSFGAEGPAGTTLARPLGIAVDAEGSVYVSDRTTSTIFVYGPKLKFQRKFTHSSLFHPASIAIDRKAQLLYVVNDPERKEGAQSVETFTLRGEHVRSLGGTSGEVEGSFHMPSGVAVSPAGELYVADKLNFRVQVFDREGRFLRRFGEQGLGAPGQFDKVHGIAFDTFGNIYICDAMQGVQILNDAYQPLMPFNGGILELPLFVAISSTNRIYVTDYTRHQVHEFQLVNTSASDSRRAPPGSDAPAAAPPGAASPATAPTQAP